MEYLESNVSIGTFTESLNEESDYALRQVWTDSPGITPSPAGLSQSIYWTDESNRISRAYAERERFQNIRTDNV